MNSKFKFGLLGKNISYSFSKGYFTEKFKKLGLIQNRYLNFDIPEIEEFPFLLYQRKHEFVGMNVTIPYKESVMKYLDIIDPIAAEIGAVNTIKVTDKDELIGYNTDVYGFQKSLEPMLKSQHKKALILGTGGASKAIAHALKTLGIDYTFVSRNGGENRFTYDQMNQAILTDYKLIINCSPVGTYPNIESAPDLPYEYISSDHYLYDLIYNPEQTAFLKHGAEKGATVKNGLEMLELQAEKSWEIWNS